jgi:hypothetical protein
MAHEPRYRQSFPSWQCLHVGSGRSHRRCPLRILWSTASLVLLSYDGIYNCHMVFGSHHIPFIYGCSYPERFLLDSGTRSKSNKVPITRRSLITIPGRSHVHQRPIFLPRKSVRILIPFVTRSHLIRCRRKINIWAAFIILSPYFGPLIAAFIISTQKWPWPFWVYTIETGLCLVATILFVDKTYYDRRIPTAQQLPKKSRLLRIIGVEQMRSRHQHNTFFQAMMRPVYVILKPTVFISTIYYLLTFARVVGINTTLAIFVTPLYNFGPK